MKKIFCLMLCAALAVSVTGCTTREPEYAEEAVMSIPERGTIEGNTYKSSLGSITFEKPDNWEYATADEIATLEAPDGVFYDMLCQDPVTGSQVSVMYEELLITAGNITTTAEEYIERISEGLYNSGLDVISQDDMEIGGKTYKSVTVYGEAENISVLQYSFAYKEGNVMVSGAVVAFNDDDIEEILACIK